MKTFLPIFILFTSFSAFAQNYRTANTFGTNYYEDSIGWRIANIPFKAENFSLQSNGDTLIAFMEVFRDPFNYNDLQCVDTAATPWQGERVLLQADGTEIYYNENNEPIIIKTQANIGDTWLFFDGNVRYEATLSQIGTATILGLTENVKTFSIQAIDANSNPIANPLNNTTYQFSENYGWVAAPNFYKFPNAIKHELKGVQNAKLGIYNITRNEVYNFNVGDEFHIREGNMFTQNYYKVFILSKQLDADNNWAYTYDVARHVLRDDSRINTDSLVIIDYENGTIPEVLLPSTLIDLSPLPNTFYQDGSGINGFGRVEKSPVWDRNQKIVDGGYWGSNNGCWSASFLLGVSYQDTYMEGLGGPYGGSNSGDAVIVSLEYYKSGSEIYGTPINFDLLSLTENVISESENVKIYPNPAQDFINIELKNISKSGFNVLIINNLGQVVQQEILTQNVQQVPVYHLPKGIYTLQIGSEAGFYVKRFVKE